MAHSCEDVVLLYCKDDIIKVDIIKKVFYENGFTVFVSDLDSSKSKDSIPVQIASKIGNTNAVFMIVGPKTGTFQVILEQDLVVAQISDPNRNLAVGNILLIDEESYPKDKLSYFFNYNKYRLTGELTFEENREIYLSIFQLIQKTNNTFNFEIANSCLNSIQYELPKSSLNQRHYIPGHNKVIPYLKKTDVIDSEEKLTSFLRTHTNVLLLVGPQLYGKSLLVNKIINNLKKEYFTNNKENEIEYKFYSGELPVERFATILYEDYDKTEELEGEKKENLTEPYNLFFSTSAYIIMSDIIKALSEEDKRKLKQKNYSWLEPLALVLKQKNFISLIIDDKNNKYSRSESYFSVISKIINNLLIDAGISNYERIYVLDIENFNSILDKYKIDKDKVLSNFLYQIKLEEISISQNHQLNNIRFLITSRNLPGLKEKDLMGNKPPLIKLKDYNQKDYIGNFIENTVINSLINSNNLNINDITSEIQSTTNGHPWFVYRWLKSFLFLISNKKIVNIDKLFLNIKENHLFWYLEAPFSKRYFHDLSLFKTRQAITESSFLVGIKKAFYIEDYEHNWILNEKLFNCYRTIIGKPGSDPEQKYIFELEKLGLIFKTNKMKGTYDYSNEIIRLQFNPDLLKDYFNIELDAK